MPKASLRHSLKGQQAGKEHPLLANWKALNSQLYRLLIGYYCSWLVGCQPCYIVVVSTTTNDQRPRPQSRPTIQPLQPTISTMEGGGEKAIPEGFERELWLKATPLIRKVALNPEIYFWYDYARGKLGLKGDVGDFVCDCVRYFFKSHGYKIRIIKEEEIE